MTIFYHEFDAPFGGMYAAGNRNGLIRLEFLQGDHTRFISTAWERNGNTTQMAPLRRAEQQLSEYFKGQRQRFDLKLHARGTEFQKSVWQALSNLGYARTASYAEIARSIKKPTAVRAVGAANAANPLAIVVPCHRVIGSNGTLTGYAGGLETKRWLLAHEQRFG